MRWLKELNRARVKTCLTFINWRKWHSIHTSLRCGARSWRTWRKDGWCKEILVKTTRCYNAAARRETIRMDFIAFSGSWDINFLPHETTFLTLWAPNSANSWKQGVLYARKGKIWTYYYSPCWEQTGIWSTWKIPIQASLTSGSRPRKVFIQKILNTS